MSQEEIIAIAIREAFKCGKEEGEAYQRLYDSMQNKADNTEQERPGIFCEKTQDDIDINLAKFKIECLKCENEQLNRQCEEKDAKITELRQELQANKDADTLLCDENRRLLESLDAKDSEIAKLQLMVPELKHSSLPLDWYVISQKANHRRKVAERKYRKKYLKKIEECRYQTERADDAFVTISQLLSDLEDCKCELRKYKNNIERAVKEERERQEENDAMRIVSLQTLLKEKKALVEKLKEENEALRNSIE